MIKTEGNVEYISVGNSRCIPRRRNWQSKRILERRLVYPQLLCDQITVDIIEEMRKNIKPKEL